MKYKNNSRKRKYRRTRKIVKARRAIFYILVIAVISFACHYAYSHISKVLNDTENEESEIRIPHFFVTDSVRFNGRYSDTFDDIQEVQEPAAIKYGITPLSNTDSVDMLISEGKLVYVPDCKYYETDEAQHPYLTPSAKELLDEIAKRYHQREGAEKQLRLTSCLRTQEAISKLMRRNRNSIRNSCHLYGTTFDISYRYLTPAEKRSLAQVLYELQQGGHCYVKYERKQPCFHITVKF